MQSDLKQHRDHILVQPQNLDMMPQHLSQRSYQSSANNGYQGPVATSHQSEGFNGVTSISSSVQNPIYSVNVPTPQGTRYHTIPEASQETEIHQGHSDSKRLLTLSPNETYRTTEKIQISAEKSIKELQSMMENQNKVNQSASIDISRQKLESKVNIKIICRIKPAKVVSNADVKRNLEFQRSRQARSNSRGKKSFSFNSQNYHSDSNQEYGYVPVRSASRHRVMESGNKASKVFNTQQSYELYSPMSNFKGKTAKKRGFSNESSGGSESQVQPARGHHTQREGNHDLTNLRSAPIHSLRRIARSSSTGTQPCLVYNKMLKNEAQYCVFTTREMSKNVFASDVPYSGKLLNESFRVAEDSKFLQNQPFQFQFDSVYDETSQGKQDKLYAQNVKSIVHNFVEGVNGCVLMFGPSDCGKTYTLKGGQGSERGIVPRAIEEVLSFVNNRSVNEKELDKTPHFTSPQPSDGQLLLKISIYMITSSEIFDLLAKPRRFAPDENHDIEKPVIEHYLDEETNSIISKVVNLNERLCLTTDDFYVAIADSYRSRKEIAYNKLNEKEIRKRSQFVISLNLVKQARQKQNKFKDVARLDFVELSGSEQAVNIQANSHFQNMKQTAVHEFVSKSFNSLSCHMMRLLQRGKRDKQKQTLISDDTETKLIGCLRETMTRDSNILLINCIDPGQHMFEHCLPALKFSASIREQIVKKLKKIRDQKRVVRKEKQSNTGTAPAEMQNLLLSQIKASERLMKDFKAQLVDFEYNLQRNPQDQETLNQCRSHSNTLCEMVRDFDTLIQYAQANTHSQNELDLELLKASHASKNRVIYLIEKLQSLLNTQQERLIVQQRHSQRHSSLENGSQSQQSEGIQVYNSCWTGEDQRESTLQTNNPPPGMIMENNGNGLQEPQMVSQQPSHEKRDRRKGFEMNTIEAIQSGTSGLHSYNVSSQKAFPNHTHHQTESFQSINPHQFNTVDNRHPAPLPQMLTSTKQVNHANLNSQTNFKSVPFSHGSLHSRSRSRSREKQGQTYHPSTFPMTVMETKNVHSLSSPFPDNQPQFIKQVSQVEGQFAQIMNEVEMPRLTAPQDIPTIDMLKTRLPCHAPSVSLIEQFQTKQLYRSEDELVNDVCRLMLLQDQEGLKLRVLQLYRDRDQILATGQTQIQVQLKEHVDCKAKELLNQEYQDTLIHNNDEMNRYTSEMQKRYSNVEQNLIYTFKDMQNQNQGLQQTIDQQKENLESVYLEKQKAEEDRIEEHRLKLEAEQERSTFEAENKKLVKNYEILKEHEMCVIRDCEAKKTQEIKENQDSLFKERERCLQLQLQVDTKHIEYQNLQDKVMQLQNDVKLKETEKEKIRDKVNMQQSEILTLKQECSNLNQKHCDDLQNIKFLQEQQETITSQRDDRSKDIDELKVDLQKKDQSKDQLSSLVSKLQKDITFLEHKNKQHEVDKEGMKKQLNQEYALTSNLRTEKDILVQNFNDERTKIQHSQESLKQMMANKDKELMMIKAAEYDKVDVLKKLAESEGQQHIYGLEVDRLKQVIYDAELKTKIKDKEISSLKDAINAKDQEKRHFNHQNQVNFDQFDTKFDSLHNQLQQSMQDNQQYKEQIQKFREKTSELEKEKQYWKEKCKVAEHKGEEINQKIVQLENELRSIIYEKQSRSSERSELHQTHTSAQINQTQKEHQKKQVFGDIQSMINRYRQNRSDSQSNKGEEDRPKQIITEPNMPSKSFRHGEKEISPYREANPLIQRHQTEPSLQSESGLIKGPTMLHVPSGQRSLHRNSGSSEHRYLEKTMTDKKNGFTTFGTATPARPDILVESANRQVHLASGGSSSEEELHRIIKRNGEPINSIPRYSRRESSKE